MALALELAVRCQSNMVRNVLLLLAIIVIGYFVGVSYISHLMSSSSQETWEAMQSTDFECPAGTEARTDGWGKLGYSRTCVNLTNGKWEAWEDGYKNIDGYYEQGKKHGVWIFYQTDSSMSKKIQYSHGVELGVDEITDRSQ